MTKTPLTLAACVLLGLGGTALAAVEIRDAVGDGAVDERVVREPVREVLIDARGGDVTLEHARTGVHVRVERNHLINTPTTSQRLSSGVLTLRTRCALGFVPCRSDYRVAVPAGVRVTVDKPSGRVDALGIGGRVTELRDGSVPLTVMAR